MPTNHRDQSMQWAQVSNAVRSPSTSLPMADALRNNNSGLLPPARCAGLWKISRSAPISERSSQPALILEDQSQMDRYFLDLAIDEDQLKMLQRVFRHACSSNELAPDSEEANTLGASLIQIYQRGVRSELALMQMLGSDDRRVSVNDRDPAPS
ncbi:hypothetical protein [Ensifer sp. 4252]|uniref:hypothetical protein n=1 Tax=Ensifer sp. 4252 TaxID=3373915 RepID=UPI003D1C520C